LGTADKIRVCGTIDRHRACQVGQRGGKRDGTGTARNVEHNDISTRVGVGLIDGPAQRSRQPVVVGIGNSVGGGQRPLSTAEQKEDQQGVLDPKGKAFLKNRQCKIFHLYKSLKR